MLARASELGHVAVEDDPDERTLVIEVRLERECPVREGMVLAVASS